MGTTRNFVGEEGRRKPRSQKLNISVLKLKNLFMIFNRSRTFISLFKQIQASQIKRFNPSFHQHYRTSIFNMADNGEKLSKNELKRRLKAEQKAKEKAEKLAERQKAEAANPTK